MSNAPEDSDYSKHGGFPTFEDVDPGPGFVRFVTAMRRLQDLAVSTDVGEDGWDEAAQRTEDLIAFLEPAQVPEGVSPAGRAPKLAGMGSLLLPPWTVTRIKSDEAELQGHFSRYHVGGNNAVHGGVLPLLFDHLFGMLVHAAGSPISRTAFLHVDYRNVTPVDTPLVVRGRVDGVEGRKSFVSAELTNDGALVADAHALMVRLLPGQP